MGVWIGLLFVGAGRIGWERGWISVAAYLVGMAAGWLVLERANPELMAARSKLRRKDTKGFDKVFFAIYLPLVFVQPYVAGRDAGCAACSVATPFWTVYPAVLLWFAACGLIGWTLVVNRYAETSVRIQKDRGHTVVTHGPYRYVRHPMYVGILLMCIAFPVIWGSLLAGAISLAVAVLFVWRTAMEDRTLQRELDGYVEFSRRTQYRLIPGLW